MTAHDLNRLGDELQRAARRDPRRPRRRVVQGLVAAAAVCAVAAGAAVAAGVFSADDVAQGMPAGSAIFGGTHPTCELRSDGVTYTCTLASLPTEERLDDHTGAKELVTIDGVIAGGCIGRDREGRRWDCYLGEEAVTRQILVHDLLGEKSFGPGRG
jgi:hypothetical protein